MHRLTQLAVIWLGCGIDKVATGFRIKKNRPHHVVQLRRRIGIGGEHGGDARDVRGTRVAGDQMLDQLFADERRNIWIEGDIVDGCASSALVIARPAAANPLSSVLDPLS